MDKTPGNQMCLKVTDDIESELKQVIQTAYNECTDDTFYVGLSGGSLPAILVKVLRELDDIDWKKWLFFFCDERCVPSASPDSTFGAFKKLLSPVDEKLPIGLHQFVAIDPALKSSKVAEDYISKMRQRFDRIPRFHLMLLGMGPDGHTCSLFPGHRLLKEANKWIGFIGDSPKPPPERITMTLPVLNNAKLCVFVIKGQDKAQVLKQIISDNDKTLPAAMVKPNEGLVYWICDTQAASKLQ